MIHGRQPEVEMFPLLAWFCSLPRTGKALVDDCGLTLQTRWRENASKREKFNFRLSSVAQKRLCLSAEITCLLERFTIRVFSRVQGAFFLTLSCKVSCNFRLFRKTSFMIIKLQSCFPKISNSKRFFSLLFF